jgi:hypothetical protein
MELDSNFTNESKPTFTRVQTLLVFNTYNGSKRIITSNNKKMYTKRRCHNNHDQFGNIPHSSQN